MNIKVCIAKIHRAITAVPVIRVASLQDADAHHRVAGGADTLGNLTAKCAPCHKNARIYSLTDS